MGAITSVRFAGTEMRIIDRNGDRWIPTNQVAAALGYDDGRPLRKLIQQMNERDELKETRHFRFLVLQTATGAKNTQVLSYRGVLRVSMRSDAPRAIEFRDWAEDVLLQVMLTGSYGGAGCYTPPTGIRVHWSDALEPKEMLKLAELRAGIWMKIAEKPDSEALWQAFYATFGGPSGYVTYLEDRGLNAPKGPEEWKRFQELRPHCTPGEWVGREARNEKQAPEHDPASNGGAQ